MTTQKETKKIIDELIGKVEQLSVGELELFFEAFFTPQELDTLAMRYMLVQKLIEGRTHRDISADLKISVSQIARGSRELKYGAGTKIFPRIFGDKPIAGKSILEEILEHKAEEVAAMRIDIPRPIIRANLPRVYSFYTAVSRKNRFAIIAEVKTKSPSVGIISNLSPMEIADIYITGGVDAISVLTDRDYFGGDMLHLSGIHRKTPSIPLLCKDFIIDRKQVYQARMAGASAVLLIVKALKTTERVRELMDFSFFLGMDSLVEVCDEKEVRIAIDAQAKIVGVNCRNLDSMRVDTSIFAKIFDKIPSNVCKIALSGLMGGEDLEKIKPLCNAALIGAGICGLPRNQMLEKINEFRSV